MFHMEKINSEKEDVLNFEKDIDEHIRKIVSKVVDDSKSLVEINKNRLSVGSAGFDSVQEVFWQPHHLRAYFDFDRALFDTRKPTFEFGGRFVNSSEFEVADFDGCRVVVKRSQIEITNKIEHKRYYVVRLDSTCRDFMVDVASKKVRECLVVLKKFISLFGGVSKFKLLSFKSQDKIAREDSIDRIPIKAEFDSALVQKVYNESNVEFKDVASAVTYLENRALERVSPEIKERLDLINTRLDSFEIRALNPLTAQIELHLEVQRETLKTLRAIQDKLPISSVLSSKSVDTSQNNALNVDNRVFYPEGGLKDTSISPNIRSTHSQVSSQDIQERIAFFETSKTLNVGF